MVVLLLSVRCFQHDIAPSERADRSNLQAAFSAPPPTRARNSHFIGTPGRQFLTLRSFRSSDAVANRVLLSLKVFRNVEQWWKWRAKGECSESRVEFHFGWIGCLETHRRELLRLWEHLYYFNKKIMKLLEIFSVKISTALHNEYIFIRVT